MQDTDYIILGALGITLLIQLFYHYFYFIRLAFYNPKSEVADREAEPVSVIICAKNESKNLQAYLPAILEQEYPNYEVVVVNNCSWDDSLDVLESFKEKYPHLNIVNIIEQEKYPKGKKFGLTLGIKAAKNEALLFTDADCVPASKHWIWQMQRTFSATKEIVLGYGPYLKEKGLLNLFIRFETFITALMYLSMARAKRPYMGIGRNLAYRRSLFFQVKGFASHNHIIPGDDDLFVNETSNAKNTAIEIDSEGFTYSIPKRKFGEWIKQKIRHLSIGKHYKGKDKRALGIFYSTIIFFYFSLIVGIILQVPLEWLGIAYGTRLLNQWIVYFSTARKLKETSLLWFLPFLDLFFFLYLLFMGSRSYFVNTRTWN